MPDERPGPILITGVNSGIGLAALLRFASGGWEVWGTVRSEDKAAVVTDAAEAAGVSHLVHPVVLDVSDHEAVVAAWPDFPPFYGVINNAGSSSMGAVEEVSPKDAKALLDVNLVAPAVVSACALPAMRERGSGRIIMISSMYGRAAVVPFNGWYHASKFGLEGLSDVLRMEVAGFGVKVSIIEPGVFKTEIDARAKEAFGHRASIATSPYQGGYERSERMMGVGGQLGLPADLLARVIVAAVESRRPLRRYLVGVDAMALVAAQAVLPRAVLDASARFMMGLG